LEKAEAFEDQTLEQGRRLKQRLKTITRKTTPMSFDERITKINEVQRGWLNYFQGTSIHGKLRDLDGWLRIKRSESRMQKKKINK
jgi:hypothetical protein